MIFCSTVCVTVYEVSVYFQTEQFTYYTISIITRDTWTLHNKNIYAAQAALTSVILLDVTHVLRLHSVFQQQEELGEKSLVSEKKNQI